MDPGRPKNKSSWNQGKPTPLHLTHSNDFIRIIVFANGHRMRNILHSDRFPKHAKSQTSQSQHVILLTSAV
jgi:hypothetical protein